MSFEIRLDRNDHHVVEDFLGSRPRHLSAIIVEANNLDRQAIVIEAARAAGIDVVVETLTERLAFPGLERSNLEYHHGQPFGPSHLTTDPDRTEFAKRVIETQMDHATVVVPPHFYADGREVLDLNIDLVAATAAASESTRIRAVITAPRSLFSTNDPRVVAKRYRIAGATEVDLRLSPLGGQNEGHRKVRSAFDIASGFKAAPLTVTLGLQGNLGQPAIAMGVADRYSVGVGYREQVNFKSLIYSQRRERDPNADFPSPNGILLPGPDITVKRKTGRALLSDSKLRGKLGVHTELLSNPEADPRGPYLTARNDQFAALQRRPPNWRIQHEYDRLTRAIELREIINDYHLPVDTPRFATRTLRSLLTLCDHYPDRD